MGVDQYASETQLMLAEEVTHFMHSRNSKVFPGFLHSQIRLELRKLIRAFARNFNSYIDREDNHPASTSIPALSEAKRTNSSFHDL